MRRSQTMLVFLCCLVPVAALAAMVLLRLPANTVILAGLVLLCPLSHLLIGSRSRHDPGGG